MEILIDMHAVGENLSGNEMYIKSLVQSMLAQRTPDIRFTLVFNYEKDLAYFEEFSEFIRNVDFDAEFTFTNDSLKRLAVIFPKLLYRKRYEIAHFQYVLPIFRNRKVKYVNTIHDMSYKRFPDYYTRKQRIIHKFIDSSAKSAHKIITCSNFSKNEILHYYKFLDTDDVIVTYYGINNRTYRKMNIAEINNNIKSLEEKAQVNIPNKFILTVGNLQPRKNLIRLMHAFSKVVDVQPGVRLVITGQKAWKYNEILYNIPGKCKDNIVFTGYVSDDELVALYNQSLLFIYPSVYEGFGFPVLEAINCGTVCLTSNVSSLKEICPIDDALFDPYNEDEIADKMLAVLKSKELYSKIKNQQLKLKDKYLWQTTAQRMLDIYQDVLNIN